MTSRREAGSLVTVFGGSGFVGRHTVRALAKDGWRARAAVRRPDLAGYLQPMGTVGQIQPVQANVRFAESVERPIAGASCVINLTGILHKSGAQTFDAVHVEGARAIARAAWKAGVRNFIHVSAIGADPKSASNYGRSKAAGEAAVLQEHPDAVIIRPSVVFGPEDDFFNRFASIARMSPVMPVIGGKTKFQPVFAGDVARAVANAAGGHAKPGTIYELGGLEVFTFRQLLDRTQQWTDRAKPSLPLPFWLAKLGAFLTVPAPNSMRPMTVDQVRMLQSDAIVSRAAIEEGRTIEALGVSEPHTIESLVPSYLERFQPKGQFAHYRS